MIKVFSIILLFFFISCSNRPVPKGILAPDSMEKIVYDLLRADEYVNSFVIRDTTQNLKKKRSIIYEQVFKLHNTTRKEFYTSYKYYQQHPDIQKALFDSLLATVNREKVEPPHSSPIKPVGAK